MPGQGEPWDESEYRLLFQAFPLAGPRLAGEALDQLARRLDRTRGAIGAQWEDARAYCRLQLSDSQTERVVLPSRLGGSGQASWDVDDPMPGVISAMEPYPGDPNER